MSDNNGKLRRLKPFLHLFVFALLSSAVCADNSTDYPDEFEDFLLIQAAPVVIPDCGVNEVYQSCEVGCIDCENRGLCEPQNCHISHCDCRMYFVHVTPGGQCEHVSVCPPRECPENEVYRHCGPYCEACDMPPCRSMECSSRCYCKQGYRRDRETGKCIPEKECPERLTCISNDVLSTKGPASDHCMQTESEALRVNETIEDEKCYCAKGYKRNMHGWCIEEEMCSFVTCLEQTEFQECPRKCNTTCWNYGDPNCKEDGQCYPGCFCSEGFVLNEFFSCIPLEACPPGSNPFVPTLPPPTVGPIPEPELEKTTNVTTEATAESGSAAAPNPGTESGSAAAPNPGTESRSAAAPNPGTESGPAAAPNSGTESGPAAAPNSGKESSSASATEPPAEIKPASAPEEGTEKSKEAEPVETTPEEITTEAPKKSPKKASKGGRVYKSFARPGKTAPESSSDASSSKSSSAEEEKA